VRVDRDSDVVAIGVSNDDATVPYEATNSTSWVRKKIRFVARQPSVDVFCWKWNGVGQAFCDGLELTSEPPPVVIVDAPGQLGVTQAQYLPPSNGAPGAYLLPEWYYPDPNTICVSRWAFYVAAAPWGPWAKIAVGPDGPDGMEQEWNDCDGRTKGYYNPTIVPKWIGDVDPSTGRREVWLIYGGDFGADGAYVMHRMRMVVQYAVKVLQ